MIIVFGSLNADLIFEMDKVPTPGQTLLASEFRLEAGGKGANQAVAAARDGAEVVMVGAVGDDALSIAALQNMASADIDVSRVISTRRKTGCASIFVDGSGQNLIAVASGANLSARAEQVEDELLDAASVLLLQMESDPAEVRELLSRAAARGIRTVLNLAPAIRLDEEALRLCSYLVVNEDEAEAAAGWLGCASDAKSLHAALGTGVIRTLGARGAEAMDASSYCHIPARRISPIDTTAAGDCFIGVLASGLDCGLSLEASLSRASAAAALACRQKGSQSSLPWREATDGFLLGAA